MFRVAVVYLDIALGLIPHYFTKNRSRMLPASNGTPQRKLSRDGPKTPISPASSAGSSSGYSTPTGPATTYYTPGNIPTPGSGHRSPAYHRRKSSYGFGAAALRHSRRSSQVSLASYGTITPIHEDEAEPPVVQETGMAPSIGLDRDFEGIGGWRLDEKEDDGNNWTNINSRLELPVERASFTRNHQRSQSLGPTTPSEGVWLMAKSPHTPHSRTNHSPEGKGHERTGSNSGTRSPGKPLGSYGNRKFNQSLQLPSALTAMDPDNFPDLVSPRTWKKSTP
ncbi:hypothetical protein B0T16DRAFT_415954 [Cercophora newfieldiana]|uniref:Uncharacterized protein n=1 Tax=Cercophora newfieldiana TaxID=92897 RepID=A0AA39Y1M9_9PEZI|nr:hypothetical protein B0T16DRAFT_415954 [Cercophora newfieldiana]